MTCHQRGLTLIEILTVTAILVILIVVSVPAFRYFQASVNLNNGRDEIISTLNFARSQTLASEGLSQYGVHFDKDNNQYTLFKGGTFESRDPSFDKIYKIADQVEISQINLKLVVSPEQSSEEVVFNKVSGTSNQEGNIILRLKTQIQDTRTIYVLASGKIVTEIPSISEVQRKKDSRHIHFDLGWSIQNATALKFKFPGPEPDQIETVATADYFNAEKTSFDWSGQFAVNGVDQEFRIHTHSLNSQDTLLCVHRDRNQGKNNEEVIIYIVDGGVDKEIAHYLADENDTCEKGEIYVSSMEIQ